MKRKLLLAALCVVSALGMRAQTDVTSTYLNNAGFEGSQTQLVKTKSSPYFNQPDNWTCSTNPGTDTYHYSTTDTGEKTEGSNSFKARFNWAGFSYNLEQTSSTLPAGNYTIQADVKVTKSNNNSTIKATLSSNGVTSESVTSNTSNFQTISVNVNLYTPGTVKIELGMQYTNSNQNSSTLCYWDNVKIIWNHDIELTGYINKATALNSVLADEDLTSAITAAEAASSAATPETDLSDAISAISGAISKAVSGLTPISLSNANFDTNVDMNASGDHSATAINTTNAGAYEVNGWTGNFGNEYVFGATAVYGTTGEINGVKSPTGDMYGETTGGTLHLSSGWNNQARYKQTVENLPSGRYVFYYEANNQNSANAIASNYFGVDGTSGDFYGGTANSFVYDENKSFAYNTWTAQAFEFDVTRESDITFHVGIVGSTALSGNGAKLWIDNVLVYRIADLMVTESDANTIISNVEALDEAVYNAADKSDLASKLSTFKSYQSIDNYNALDASLTTAQSSVSVYMAINTALTYLEDRTDKTASVASMRTKYTDGTYSDETTVPDIYAEYQGLEFAALAAAGASDYTSVIINPSFETNDMTGWSAESRSDTGVKSTANGTYAITSGDRTSGSYMFNTWGGTAENNVYQTIKNLPAGTYTLAAVLAGFKDEELVLAANEITETTTVDGDKTVGYLTYVTFTIDVAGDVVIKASNTKGQDDSDASFIKADNFQLYVGTGVLGSAYKPNLLAAINEVSYPTANVGTAAFQISSAEVKKVTDAIAEAQGVYDDDDATKEEIETAISTLETGVAAADLTTLNAPTPGKRIQIVNVTPSGSFDFSGKALTYYENPSQTEGGFGYKYMLEPNANCSQGFIFKEVGGQLNTYTMSFVDATGTTRYVCSQYGYNSNASGDKSRIRTTTDAEYALKVRVDATTTDGVWRLYNTEAEKYIGTNGKDNDDFFTNPDRSDLKLTEISRASITINTTAAGWGTVILPFAVASLPTGVKAYTCAAVVGTTLTLESVDALEANKPYIIEGSWDETLTDDAQGAALTYSEGLLTGVYADTPAEDGWYVLQKNNGVVAFYLVDTNEATPTVGANRCYMPNGGGSAKAFFFPGDDEATVIEGLDALTAGEYEAIYTMGGVKVNALQKGTNIVQLKSGKTIKINVK